MIRLLRWLNICVPENVVLAQELGIGKNRLIKEITCINNLTGVLKLKEISKNRIILNTLWCENLEREIAKSSN